MDEESVRKFGPTNGRILGWLAMVVGVVAIVLIFVGGAGFGDATSIVLVALVMSLVWAIMLRPAVHQRGDDLVLRQSFTDVVIPFVRVKYVTVRMFMVVATAERAYHTSAIGRSRRALMKHDRAGSDPVGDHVDLIEQQLNQLCEDARAKKLPEHPIRRTPARLEIGVVVGLAVLAAVLLVLT
ncbi:hypothetical protein [Nocardioides sp. Root151]|uniref:hypothetical protein n=1 Tax=Nocardioides sp. Root151 TaxID=1736475 RepID=UPI00070263E0|nr:hypothetical protein [Nocardioides sp. Root151]KQZ67358.1 hypothetical protein ASD66_20610 [Nocardioides sp. Root151]